MGTGQTIAAGVPGAVLADLRAEFAAEIAARLERLDALDDLDVARRDAHVIASSAWVVGEPEIARIARQVEHELPGGPLDELLELLRGYVA